MGGIGAASRKESVEMGGWVAVSGVRGRWRRVGRSRELKSETRETERKEKCGDIMLCPWSIRVWKLRVKVKKDMNQSR
jgi:hypothetical protein